MLNDKFGNPIYQEQDIIDLIYKSLEFDNVIVEHTPGIDQFERHSGLNLNKFDSSIEEISIAEFDTVCQQNWFIPEEYRTLDIEEYLVRKCPTENYNRLLEELQEYKSRNLLSLLCVLKYLVDTFRQNKILWGVGRGSSVASYVLYLLEVHRIDSVKYNLDWHEFLK